LNRRWRFGKRSLCRPYASISLAKSNSLEHTDPDYRANVRAKRDGTGCVWIELKELIK
jgi:hypothetical protein